MKVILAGYSKTGTKTMCKAFQLLGYNTYDSLEHGYYHYKEWVKIITQGSTVEDFQRMYEGIDAVTDAPCFVFWEQIHEAFPDAKIVLTLRDEDKWYRSLVKQFDDLNSSYMIWLFNIVCPTWWIRRNYHYHTLKIFGDMARFPNNKITLLGETLLKQNYRQHNVYVQQKAPKDKLLVYEVSQGWSPLCEFLGEEIPNQPFPHKNKSGRLVEEMSQENDVMKTLLRHGMISTGVAAMLLCYVGYKVYRKIDFHHAWHVAFRHMTIFKTYIV